MRRRRRRTRRKKKERGPPAAPRPTTNQWRINELLPKDGPLSEAGFDCGGGGRQPNPAIGVEEAPADDDD
nr:unnamed protein product [Digitaria exilis]